MVGEHRCLLLLSQGKGYLSTLPVGAVCTMCDTKSYLVQQAHASLLGRCHKFQPHSVPLTLFYRVRYLNKESRECISSATNDSGEQPDSGPYFEPGGPPPRLHQCLRGCGPRFHSPGARPGLPLFPWTKSRPPTTPWGNCPIVSCPLSCTVDAISVVHTSELGFSLHAQRLIRELDSGRPAPQPGD